MLEEEYETRRRLPPHLRPVIEPEPAFSYHVRDAVRYDLPAIREIYNHYVRNSSITFDSSAWSLPELRQKFDRMAQRGLPFLVAVSPNGDLLGFAYVYPWKSKAAYRFSVENHIYLGPASTGKGLGTVLMSQLIERCRAARMREMIAVIADRGAEASIALHENLGFTIVAQMGRVGYKYERWLGTVMMRKSLR